MLFKFLITRYGTFHLLQYIPFVPDADSQLRQASVGGKTFYYEEDRDIDVNSLLTKDLEKVPVEVALRSECIECFSES